jgi:hypothetical protein
VEAVQHSARVTLSEAALSAAIRDAEAALFQRAPAPDLSGEAELPETPRRILRDLAQLEQPPMHIAERESRRPRGRRPGSKNKPKLTPPDRVHAVAPVAEERNSHLELDRSSRLLPPGPAKPAPIRAEPDQPEQAAGEHVGSPANSPPRATIRPTGQSLLRTIMGRYVFVAKPKRGQEWKRRIIDRY